MTECQNRSSKPQRKARKMGKEEAQQVCVLELPSQQSFAKSFSNLQLGDEVTVEVTVPGQNKPMVLNKFVLANASDLLRDVLFKNTPCAWLRVEDANTRPVKAVWVAQSTGGATEGAAVQNVLELCSGQKVSVGTHTAAATAVIMKAMTLHDKQATSRLVEWMKEQGTKDVAMGVRMVCECAMFESLYAKSGSEGVAMELAKHVLARRNMKDWNVAAEDELMELPCVFVLAASFCSPHDKFTAVRRFIKYNWTQLSMGDKRELLQQCDLSELGSKDAKLLCRLDVLGTKELIETLCAIVGKMENKLEQQAEELRASEQERAEQNAKISAMATQLEQQADELRASEQERAALKAEICAMAKQLEQQAQELRVSEQKRSKLKAEIVAMAKQAEGLPLDQLCIPLKIQVPIKHLNLSGENQHSELLPLVFFHHLTFQSNRKRDWSGRSKITERSIEDKHNTPLTESIL